MKNWKYICIYDLYNEFSAPLAMRYMFQAQYLRNGCIALIDLHELYTVGNLIKRYIWGRFISQRGAISTWLAPG